MESTQVTLSNFEVLMLLVGIFGVFAVVFILLYALFEPEDALGKARKPFIFWKKLKQEKCRHLWRRTDASYEHKETLFHYRCEKCGFKKKLFETEAKRFEKDFMSDWE